MSMTAGNLVDEITLEFSRVCIEHAQAVLQHREKDTPSSRALVAECSAKIDSLLDLYLEAGTVRR